MSTTDLSINKSAAVAVKHFDVPVASLVASATTTVFSAQPKFKYQVVGVDVFCNGAVLNTTVDVKIGGTSVLTGPITPVSGSIVAGTLSPTLALLKGTTTLPVNIQTICGATPTAPYLAVVVRYRARPLNGEV